MSRAERVQFIRDNWHNSYEPDFRWLARKAQLDGLFSPKTVLGDIECSFSRAWIHRRRGMPGGSQFSI